MIAENQESRRPMTDRIRAALADPALDQLFRTARTHNAWLSRPVSFDEACQTL